MDPISIGLGVVGLGMSLFGGSEASSAARHQAEISRQVAGQEQLVNAQKQQAMELSSRRQQLEIMRNSQRARSMALNSAVNQGAQFGTGLQGGLAQIADSEAYNMLGVNQNLQIGRNISGINDTISGLKGQMAGAQADQATAQGLQSLGGALMTNAGTIGNLGKNAFGSMSFGDPLGGFGGSSRWGIG